MHTASVRRRYHRLLSALAFCVLAVAAEVVGRSLTLRIDIGRHVAAPSYAAAAWYPFLLAALKLGIALLLARIAWRIGRARALARAGSGMLAAVGRRGRRAPRVRLSLSPALWLRSFALTSLLYLAQADVARGGVLSPWLHSSALPVFAVLSVVVAVLFGAVARWLDDYEDYAHATWRAARRASAGAAPAGIRRAGRVPPPPRRLFGLALDSRPPPLAG